MKSFSKKFSKNILYLAVMSCAQVVGAQGLVLEEVIVTAQKREVTSLDVPMTVNAITGKSISDYKIFDFKDLANLTPGLTLNNISGQKSSISLRGITFDPDSNAASSVDVYWNEVRVHPSVAFQELFDLNRVEVLRGPQGSLQGRTSPGGAVVLVTNSPDIDSEDVSGDILQTFSDRGDTNTQIGVTVPLIPNELALRAAAVYDENKLNGIRNKETGTRQSNRAKGGRLSVAWSPVEDFRLVLSTEYLEKFGRYPLALEGSRAGSNQFETNDRRSNTHLDSATDNKKSVSVMKIEYDLEAHTITSLTGYVDRSTNDNFDFDYTNLSKGVAHKTQVAITEEEFTQEFRIASDTTHDFNYMSGVYYRKRDHQTDFTIDAVPSNGAFSVYNDIPIEEEEFGVFVHGEYRLSKDIGVQAGLRWQKNNIFSRVDTYTKNGFPVPGILLSSSISDKNSRGSSREVTGSLRFTYDINDDVMSYISYEKGFRPGGVTISQHDLPEERILFGDEVSHAIELGVKSQLFNNKLQLSLAAYYQEFSDLISFRRGIAFDSSKPLDGVADTSINGITDSADAVIQGFEIDVQGLITDNWSASFGFAYNDTHYKSGEDLLCTRFEGGQAVTTPGKPFATCDVGGRRISGEPLWSANIKSEYAAGLSESYNAFVRGLYKFSTSQHDDDYGITTASYGIANFHFGLRPKSQMWEASLWVKNAFGKEGDAKLPIPLLGTGYNWVNSIEERTVGASFQYSF